MANTYDVTQKLQAIADAISQGGGGGGGTTVIANPSGTPTADLNTVQIGQVIYDIPGGGGGGSGYTVTTLWSGSPTTTSIALSDSVLNYDAIYCEVKFNNEAIMCNTIDKATFDIHLGTDYIAFTSHSNQYMGITPASTATSFTFFSSNVNGCTRVIGLKYARGAGSDQAIDIEYDNTTSGLTATNVQDAIDENADNISKLNSKLPQTDSLLVTNASCSKTYANGLPKAVIIATKTKNNYVMDGIIFITNGVVTANFRVLTLSGGGAIVDGTASLSDNTLTINMPSGTFNNEYLNIVEIF